MHCKIGSIFPLDYEITICSIGVIWQLKVFILIYGRLSTQVKWQNGSKKNLESPFWLFFTKSGFLKIKIWWLDLFCHVYWVLYYKFEFLTQLQAISFLYFPLMSWGNKGVRWLLKKQFHQIVIGLHHYFCKRVVKHDSPLWWSRKTKN